MTQRECEGYCEEGAVAVYKDPEFPSGPINLCKDCYRDKLEELADQCDEQSGQYWEEIKKLS